MSQPIEGAGPRRHADELRHEIDSGRTGDKVAYPDPAAAPLGTDDEAAGHGPASASVRRALHDEAVHRDSAIAGANGSAGTLEGGPAYALIGVVVIAVLLMLYYVIGHMR